MGDHGPWRKNKSSGKPELFILLISEPQTVLRPILIREAGLKRSFILIDRHVFHAAAGLDIQFGATAGLIISLHRLPASAGGHPDASEVIRTVFGKFLDMQKSPELNGIQGAITMFGYLHMGFPFIALSHFIGGNAIIFRTIEEHDHIGILLD